MALLSFPAFGQIPVPSCYFRTESLMCGYQIDIQNDSIAVLGMGCDRSGTFVYVHYTLGEDKLVTFHPLERSVLSPLVIPVYGSDTLMPASRITSSCWFDKKSEFTLTYRPMSENNAEPCYTIGLPVSEVIPAQQNGKFLSHVKVNLPDLYFLYTDRQYAPHPEEVIAFFEGYTFINGTFIKKSQKGSAADEAFIRGGVER